jgi:transcriptional regulator with XRE-family HTH domain
VLSTMITTVDLANTRRLLGVSQRRLALMLGVSQVMVARIELGIRRLPPRRARLLALLLDRPAGEDTTA